MRQYLIGGAIGSFATLVFLAFAWTLLPAWIAGYSYSNSYDSTVQCEAARRAADAWSAAGFAGKAVEWQQESRGPCALAELRARYG